MQRSDGYHGSEDDHADGKPKAMSHLQEQQVPDHQPAFLAYGRHNLIVKTGARRNTQQEGLSCSSQEKYLLLQEWREEAPDAAAASKFAGKNELFELGNDHGGYGKKVVAPGPMCPTASRAGPRCRKDRRY